MQSICWFYRMINGGSGFDDHAPGEVIDAEDDRTCTLARRARSLDAIRAGNQGDSVGASWADVVTANRFVTDLSDQDALNRVWAEYFSDAKPTTTTVQVVRLATDPRCLIEINAIAVID
jgi:enamine deaminase RidA (YjgF/YER057c/UK114 family)